MSVSRPHTRTEFKDYCLRKLGHPVIEVDVDDDQIEMAIDDTFQYMHEYNTEAIEKVYLKHQVTQDEIDRQMSVPEITGTTISFENTETNTNHDTQDEIHDSGNGFVDAGFVSGQQISVSGSGSNDGTFTVASVEAGTITLIRENSLTTESAGSNVTITTILKDASGYIELNDQILNVTGVWVLTSNNMSSNMFSLTYQYMLNNVHDIAFGGLINHTTTRSYLTMLQQIMTGDKSVRYKRYQNRLMIDMNWDEFFSAGNYVIIECYRAMQPDSYTQLYNDILAKKYCTALIKKQWGTNLKKYQGLQLPGGVVVDGQTMYNEALVEIEQIEAEALNAWSGPCDFFCG